MPLKYFLTIFFLVNNLLSFAQIKYSFPLDTVDITGNFGEIRNNHFHQGIDFSTKGKENLPVKSIDEGYVYRIKISSYGYGKALYIHHPSGFLSVYAHLNNFSDKIQSLVNKYLIEQKTNQIDILLKEDSIKITKNEIIGFSGNTGSSTGPHLHFEIRNELTEIPINPFFFFHIKDTTKPNIEKIMFYDLSDTIQPKPVLSTQKNLSDTILVPPITGIAFSGNDKIYPKGNPNNIYKVSIFLDNQKIYQHRLYYITFDNTIYVEYFSEKFNKHIIQKCFTPHLYPSYFYDTLVNKGRIILSDTNIHSVKISFCDENNNCTDTTFYIHTKQKPSYKKINIKKLLLCTKPIHIKNSYFELYVPEKSFFQDLKTNIFYNTEKKQIQFNHSPVSLRFPATLNVYHNLKNNELNKTLLVSSKKFYLPDTFDHQKIIFKINELNNFSLYTDITPPIIKPLPYNKKLKAISISYLQKKLFFQISDNTSVKSYEVYFNSQFCKAYYYASKKILQVDLPDELIAADENLIQIIVSDLVNNTTTKSYRVVFK